MPVVFILCGALFGLLLSRARVTDYDLMMGMFLLDEFHVAGVMGVAIGVAGVGLWWLRRSQARTVTGQPIEVKPKPYRGAGTFVGGLVFGTGWALTGTCPGTSLAQIGEGKMYALFTVAGVFLGTFAFGWLSDRRGRPAPSAAPGPGAGSGNPALGPAGG